MIEDIRIYDWDLNLLHIQHDITTVNWEIHYNAIGSFEGHFPINSKLAEICGKHKYIIVTQGKKQAVGIGITANNELIIFGRTPNWLFTKRSVAAFKTSELTERLYNSEAVARYAFSQCYINNEIAAANDADFILGEPLGIPDDADYNFWRNTRKPLDSVIIEALGSYGLGHRFRVDFEQKKWVFEVLNGTDVKFVLSEDNRNAYDMEYNFDILDMATAGWYEYVPEAEEQDDISELQSEWRYLESDATQFGRYRLEEILTGSDEYEAKTNLTQKKLNETLQGKMKKYRYDIDYKLGDIVSAQYKRQNLCLRKRCRVTGVNIWLGESGNGEEPILENLED